MIWGFNSNDLGIEDNIYLKVTEELVNKLVALTQADNLSENHWDWLKSLISVVSEFQYSEPLVFYACLKPYIESLITVLAKGTYGNKCQKASMVALYRVVNTDVFNHTEYNKIEQKITGNEPSNVGIINLPAKFSNFQEEVKTAIISYREVFSEENVVSLLDLLAGKFLKLDSLYLWQDDPEQFIEIEDEIQYTRNSTINKDWAYNLLSYVLWNKLLEYFYDIAYPWLANHLSHVIENQAPIEVLLNYAKENLGEAGSEDHNIEISILVEDAILSLVGLLPCVYKYKKIPDDNRLKIEVVLSHLENRINATDSQIFKRRYCLLLSLWAEEINLQVLLEYLAKSCSILFSKDSTDAVVKFTAMSTFRDILRVLEELRKVHKPKIIHDENSAQIVNLLDQNLNYKELFESISPICIAAMSEFEAPMQIWKFVNLISVLIEGCKENSDEESLNNFKNIDFLKIIKLDSPLLKEAIYDMCKNLMSIFKNSLSIFEINFKLLEHNIQSNIEYELFEHWLYLIRIFDFETSTDAAKLCSNFGALCYDTLKQCGTSAKYSVVICEILQEYVLSGLVPPSFEEK